jgi:hypothetical protein
MNFAKIKYDKIKIKIKTSLNAKSLLESTD